MKGSHLRAVGIGAGVGHGQEPRSGVAESEVLVFANGEHQLRSICNDGVERTSELLSVDRLATRAVVPCEVTPL